MATPNADRNLLFGILALQMDFISRDALIAAMNAWVLDKAKTARRDPRRAESAWPPIAGPCWSRWSRSTSSSTATTPRRAWRPSAPLARCGTSWSGSATQTSRPACRAIASARRGRPVSPPATYVSAGESTSAGQRFRILRPHAKGGLGEVFVARDEELRREVALKQIQDRHADDARSRARFLLEAEVTGGLEHPGVVPVYGLGQYPDGRPFYAMRFVKGDSLKDAIERFYQADASGRDPGERSLEFRKLLGRFIDVCNAVGYAHSRGVLHRDLKPGNVMLGPYGETLVVDWGLAKVVGRPEEAATQSERRRSAHRRPAARRQRRWARRSARRNS